MHKILTAALIAGTLLAAPALATGSKDFGQSVKPITTSAPVTASSSKDFGQ